MQSSLGSSVRLYPEAHVNVTSAAFIVPDHSWESAFEVPFATVDTAFGGKLVVKCDTRFFEAASAVMEFFDLLAHSWGEDAEALVPGFIELGLRLWIEFGEGRSLSFSHSLAGNCFLVFDQDCWVIDGLPEFE